MDHSSGADHDVITTQDVDRILGLPPGQLRPLAQAGFLERLEGVSGRGKFRRSYSKSQVERFLADIIEKVPVRKVAGSVSLIVCARRMRVEPGQLAARAAKGDLVPVGRSLESRGLMGLRFLDPGRSIEWRHGRITPRKTLDRLRELALAKPTASQATFSKLLAAEGKRMSPPVVRKHLIRMGLGRQEDRARAASLARLSDSGSGGQP